MYIVYFFNFSDSVVRNIDLSVTALATASMFDETG
jgi:hypothetical protein